MKSRMLALLCLFYFMLSTVKTDDIDIVQVYRTIGTVSREEAAGVLEKYGAKDLGKMLQKKVIKDCVFPEEDITDPSFNMEELLQEALKITSDISILDQSIVCLNHGKYKDTHSSASVFVKYSIQGNDSVATTQVPILCSEGEWIAGYIKPSHSNDGSLKTKARDDCQMCPNSNMLSASSTSCLECPDDCTSRRCRINGKCCEVYDFNYKCAQKCPTHSHQDGSQCKCDKGRIYRRGKCRKAPPCQCRNGGKCIEGRGICRCPDGFAGRRCDRCTIPNCLKCKYSKQENEAVCLKRKAPCSVKFIKEPPTYEELRCNPFEGSGYTLQCSIEVPRKLKSKIELHWRFITEKGDGIDLEAPFLQSILSISKKTVNRGRNVRISSVLTTTFDSETTFFGISIQESAFQYLKGGSVYCEPLIPESEKLFLPSNFLTMPVTKPPLAPCTSSTVYAIDTGRCADFNEAEDEEVSYYSSSGPSQYQPDDVGAVFEASKIDKELGRAFESDDDSKGNMRMEPWVFILGMIGGILLVIAMTIPIVLLALHFKNKNKKKAQQNPLKLQDGYLGPNRHRTSNSSLTVVRPAISGDETDSVISQARRGSITLKR